MHKAEIIKEVFECIADGNVEKGKDIIEKKYEFSFIEPQKRNYTIKQKMETFLRDGFIDRYSGERLLNPGVLKVISTICPSEFPCHLHWKMSASHIAYWELFPTIDHIYPVARGGADEPDNWVTTSMLHNQVKNNWTLEQLNWTLHNRGDINEWDGLTSLFVDFVSRSPELLKDTYINNWFRISSQLIG